MNEEHSEARPQRSGDIQEPGSGGPAAGKAGLPADYPAVLAEIKARIAAARTRAVLAVNSELIRLYWEIGHEILERQAREGWGSGVTTPPGRATRASLATLADVSLIPCVLTTSN